MFNDDCKLDESVIRNPHLKEFVIQDNSTAQRLFEIIDGPSTIKRTRKRKLHFAIKKEFNMLFDMLTTQRKKKGKSEMTKDIIEELNALFIATRAVTACFKVNQGLITQDEANRELKELGFTPDEAAWMQSETERLKREYEEDAE